MIVGLVFAVAQSCTTSITLVIVSLVFAVGDLLTAVSTGVLAFCCFVRIANGCTTSITLVILGIYICTISNLLAAVSTGVLAFCCFVRIAACFTANITLMILGSCIGMSGSSNFHSLHMADRATFTLTIVLGSSGAAASFCKHIGSLGEVMRGMCLAQRNIVKVVNTAGILLVVQHNGGIHRIYICRHRNCYIPTNPVAVTGGSALCAICADNFLFAKIFEISIKEADVNRNGSYICFAFCSKIQSSRISNGHIGRVSVKGIARMALERECLVALLHNKLQRTAALGRETPSIEFQILYGQTIFTNSLINFFACFLNFRNLPHLDVIHAHCAADIEHRQHIYRISGNIDIGCAISHPITGHSHIGCGLLSNAHTVGIVEIGVNSQIGIITGYLCS